MTNQTNGNGSSNGNGNGGTPPLRTIRDGALSSSIWERQGEEGPFYTTKIVRNWQDEKGRWHESSSFSESDLRRLPDLARNSGDVIAVQRYQNTMMDRAAEVQPEANPDPTPLQEEAPQKSAYQQKRSAPNSKPVEDTKQKITP